MIPPDYTDVSQESPREACANLAMTIRGQSADFSMWAAAHGALKNDSERADLYKFFALPLATEAAVAPVDSLVRKHAPDGSQTGLATNAEERSRTPEGFARAFFESNP